MAPFRIVVLLLVAAIVSLGPTAARAEAIVVPDGRFESLTDYLAGTWAATRPATHVTFRITFTRGGEFTFNNHGGGTSVFGRYEAGGNGIRMIIQRTCTDNGRSCAPRDPPVDTSYPIRPLNSNEYESADEHWRRVSRN